MDSSTHQSPGAAALHSCAAGERLRQQLESDQLDAAIEDGLMQFVPCASCASPVVQVVYAAQARLRRAWAARDRHLARKARLAARSDARAAGRRSTQGSATALPPAAAAALARARAKAGSKDHGGA